MEVTSFSNYCESILLNPDLGSKIFFQDKDTKYSYQNLIESALCRAHYFTNSPDTFFALQFESPYKLMTHLLGAILAQKNVLILSSKEPKAQMTRLQESIPFTQILNDQDLEVSLKVFKFPAMEINLERPAFFILSSGSSGPSKGIPLSLNNIYYSAMSVIKFFKMNSNDTSFSNLPHHHIGGLMIFWRAFFSMGKVTTDDSFEYQFISLVPLQLQRIISNADQVHKLKSCRGVLIGGSPLNLALKETATNLLIPIFETYGMSETSSLVMLNGKPLEGQEVKLSSEGYFLVKGKTLTNSVSLDQEGFYHTKDIGIKNSDGTFSFKHRGDLLFKSGGELINPQELEAKIKELEWITEAVVTPINHHEWTQAGVMVYKTSDDKKNDTDIKEYLKIHFHPYQIPKYFFAAPKDLISEGIKPRRFEISHFAQTNYYKELFHHLYIPHESSKKLLVFFHGFMEDHTDLIPLMDNHKETSYLFIDLPGHGKTKTSNFKSRHAIFSELQAMINFYKRENSLLLYGYSMGGRIALELTLLGLKPDILFLESAYFGLINDEEKLSRQKADNKLFEESPTNLKIFFEHWYKNPIFSNYNQSNHYKMDIEKKLSHNPNEWQKSLEFFSPGVFPFSQSEVSTLLKNQKIIGIVGIEDTKYKNHFEEMRLKFAELSIYEIEDAGHNPHKTHVSDVKKILRLLD